MCDIYSLATYVNTTDHQLTRPGSMPPAHGFQNIENAQSMLDNCIYDTVNTVLGCSVVSYNTSGAF